jgi:hypothetical protein
LSQISQIKWIDLCVWLALSFSTFWNNYLLLETKKKDFNFFFLFSINDTRPLGTPAPHTQIYKISAASKRERELKKERGREGKKERE